MRKQRGITLIALIVTIIILLILAGITINFMLGDNGILNRAKNAGETYEEQAARERLEIALADLTADKVTDNSYNENEYIDNKLIAQDMIVNGDIVIVDGWQFEIDRSVPQISANLGKGESNEQIKLVVSQTVSSDYVKSTIKVEIEYLGEISFIKIAGEEIALPEKKDGKYIVEKEIIANGNYSVLVKDKEEKYQIGSIKVSDITEDMDIWTKADMELFRDQVNSGRTYEGRTVRVMADIDLAGNEQNQWIPIGDYLTNDASYFSGIFEGNNHTITNLYINNSNQHQGLFGIIRNATIKNIGIDNSYIKGGNHIGTIVGRGSGVNLERSIVSKNVTVIGSTTTGSGTYVGGIIGDAESSYDENTYIKNCINYANVTGVGNHVGGIVGVITGQIEECINYGNINGNATSVGGIIGCNYKSATIINSYNIAKISGNRAVGGIAGYSHPTESLIVKNCYNIGDIIGNSINQIVGEYQSVPVITNCYYRGQNFTSSILGEAFTEDSNNINNGYPILKWQK